jgi:hypothetical protein
MFKTLIQVGGRAVGKHYIVREGERFPVRTIVPGARHEYRVEVDDLSTPSLATQSRLEGVLDGYSDLLEFETSHAKRTQSVASSRLRHSDGIQLHRNNSGSEGLELRVEFDYPDGTYAGMSSFTVKIK